MEEENRDSETEHLLSGILTERQLVRQQSFRALPDGKLDMPWYSNPRVWFRHPSARLLTTVVIMLFDLLIYAEDPYADSKIRCVMPGVGEVLNFAARLYTWRSHPGWAVFKLFLLFGCILLGAVVGRQFLQRRVFKQCLRLRMFSEDRGTWFCMILCVVPFAILAIFLYNQAIPSDVPQISADLGITEDDFGKLAQCLTWVGDLLAIIMTWDSILQDVVFFPHWIPRFKLWYVSFCGGWGRVVLVWVTFLASTVGMFWLIWDVKQGLHLSGMTWNQNAWLSTDELSRVLICSAILFCDLLILFQDWEFPSFDSSTNIKIAGTNSKELECHCCAEATCEGCGRCCACSKQDCAVDCAKFCTVKCTGKWMTYAPLLFVIFTEIMLIRSMVVYRPSDFGQYIDPSDRTIWVIEDKQLLETCYDANAVLVRPDLVNYDAREDFRNVSIYGAMADQHTLTRQIGYQDWQKWLGGTPGYIMLVFVTIMTFVANPLENSALVIPLKDKGEVLPSNHFARRCKRWCRCVFCFNCCGCAGDGSSSSDDDSDTDLSDSIEDTWGEDRKNNFMVTPDTA